MKKSLIMLGLAIGSFTQCFTVDILEQTSLFPINQYIQGQMEESQEGFQRRYILTGGPGVGKTSIINCFRTLGHFTVNEAATAIINEALSNGISEPWAKSDFEDKIVDLQIKNYRDAITSNAHFIFFDRGPIDPLTYVLRSNQVPSKKLVNYVQKTIDARLYDKTVFLIENLGFCNRDIHRVESNDQSLEIEQSLVNNYKALGFKVIRIPPFPELETEAAILKRTKLILNYCEKAY